MLGMSVGMSAVFASVAFGEGASLTGNKTDSHFASAATTLALGVRGREEFVANSRLAPVVPTTIRSTVSDRVFLSLLRNTIFVSS